MAVIEHALCPDSWNENMKKLNQFLFDEV
jgi:hypothetical protein